MEFILIGSGVIVGFIMAVIFDLWKFGKRCIGDLHVEQDTPESNPLLWMELKADDMKKGIESIQRKRYVTMYVVKDHKE